MIPSFRIVFLIAALLFSLPFTGCSGKEEKEEELIRPVRYEQVFATGGGRGRTFSGAAQAGIESRLSFKVAGTVEAVEASVGDRVEEGKRLATIDASDYRLRLQEAEAALAQAEAQERNARSNYERTQALYENRNASKKDLDQARAANESATAQVRSSEKRLELARLQVRYCTLRAPFEGAVAAVEIEENENVSPGQTVAVLTAGERPEVRVSVPEVLIAQINTGDRSTATFDALPDRTFDATVSEVGVASVGFATTFPVTVRLDEETDEVRPGMAAEVTFRFDPAEGGERILVPPVAVGEDREGRYVFVVMPTEEGLGVAQRRAVEVGELTSEGLEILDGLREGDLVVTAGVSRIIDGQTVKLL
jgi:RND family efflux transporter MFP subunit